mgnify:CR=1 FL=1
MTDLKEVARQIRILTLRSIHASRAAHPGGSLSCTEIMVSLFFEQMQPNPYSWSDPNRDIFINSKGHSAPCQYSILHLLGILTLDQLMNLRKGDSGPCQGHPSYPHLPQVEASSGSLGVAASVSVGIALGRKQTGNPGRVYCLIGEGDLNEGVTVEAARIASHYQLDNLCWILDFNQKMSDGYSKIMVSPRREFDALNWSVRLVNGHNFDQLRVGFRGARETKGFPTVIIAQTIKGSGVSWMESDPAGYHGSITLSQEDLDKALLELETR